MAALHSKLTATVFPKSVMLCPKMFHFMSNYSMLCSVRKVWVDSRRDGSIFTFFWVLDTKRGGEDVALEHPPEAWVPFSCGETEHICVTGAYSSEGTAGFYLFSVFKKPYPVHCRNTQSFSCAYRSCTKVYFRVQTNFCQAIGTKQGVHVC